MVAWENIIMASSYQLEIFIVMLDEKAVYA